MTINTERLQTGLWLLNKRPRLCKRVCLHLQFRAENRAWGQSFDWGNRIRDALARILADIDIREAFYFDALIVGQSSAILKVPFSSFHLDNIESMHLSSSESL